MPGWLWVTIGSGVELARCELNKWHWISLFDYGSIELGQVGPNFRSFTFSIGLGYTYWEGKNSKELWPEMGIEATQQWYMCRPLIFYDVSDGGTNGMKLGEQWWCWLVNFKKWDKDHQNLEAIRTQKKIKISWNNKGSMCNVPKRKFLKLFTHKILVRSAGIRYIFELATIVPMSLYNLFCFCFKYVI